MGKLYLLTGATGHLGSVLVRELLQGGADVRALVLPGDRAPLPDGVHRVAGDVLDPASLGAFFARDGYDAVTLFHCAAKITILSKADPDLWRVNVEGTKNVMALALESRVERTVYVSSVHAIPELPFPQVIDESAPLSPDTVYGQYAKSKAAAANVVLQAFGDGLDVSIVHPSGIIGPGDSLGNNHSVRTIEAIARGKIPANIRGGYDFVDVRDVAAGILQCERRGRPGERYILNGHYVTIPELTRLICEFTGRRPPRLTLPDALVRAAAPIGERASLLMGRKPLLTPYSLYTLKTNGIFSHGKAERELGYQVRELRATIRDMLAR